MIGSRLTLGEPVGKLSAPTAFIATVISDTAIDIAWVSTDVNATGSNIYRNTTGGSYVFGDLIGTSNNGIYNDTGLSGSTTYYYFIEDTAIGYIPSDALMGDATTDIPTNKLSSPVLNTVNTEGVHRVIFELTFPTIETETVEITRTSVNGTTVLEMPIASASTYVIGGLSPGVEYTWDFIAKTTNPLFNDSDPSQHIETMGAAPVKDTIPTAIYSRYGFVNTLTSYTGNWARVKRDSDNTFTTIGFKPSGAIDLEALEAFCNGANGYAYPYDLGGSNDLIETADFVEDNPPKVYDSILGCDGYFNHNGGGFAIQNVSDIPLATDDNSIFVSGKTKNTLPNIVFSMFGDLFSFKGGTGVLDGKFYYRAIFGNKEETVPSLTTNTKYKLAHTNDGTTLATLYFNGLSQTTTTFTNDRPYSAQDNVFAVLTSNSFGGYDTQFLLEDILFYKSDESANVATINNEHTNYFG